MGSTHTFTHHFPFYAPRKQSLKVTSRLSSLFRLIHQAAAASTVSLLSYNPRRVVCLCVCA